LSPDRLSRADRYAGSPASGDQLIAATSGWNAPPGSTLGSHQVSVYTTTAALRAGRR
jgi:hypothetical protein